MKEVDADLYEFLKNHETGIYKEENTVVIYVCINFYDIGEFQNILGADWFVEGNINCILQDGYICVDLNDYIEEGLGHKLSSYKNCFELDDWENYKEDILKKEKTVEEFCDEFLKEDEINE